jgi:hypothetical protein
MGNTATSNPQHQTGEEKMTTRKSVSQITRARMISRSLGFYVAARYLALRGWSLDAARFILLGV